MGRQPQSLTGHSDLRKAKKRAQLAVFTHPCPVHRHQSAASCQLRTAFAASSPLLSLQHFDVEKKGTGHGVGSTFLFHLTFKSHLHQLQSFICTMQPELSKPLQISDGQREKLSVSWQGSKDAPWRKERFGVQTYSSSDWSSELRTLTSLWGSLRAFY